MAWKGRLGRIDLSGGPNDEYDEMNGRGRLVSLDCSGEPDGDRSVQEDQQLRAGGQHGSDKIGS